MHLIFHDHTDQWHASQARLLSDDEGFAQTWRPQPSCMYVMYAGLINMRVHVSLMTLDIHCNWQLSKQQNPLTSVTWPYGGLRCSLWGYLLDDRVAQDDAQRKYTCQIRSTCACSLHLCNLIWEIHFMVNRQLSKQGIRRPVSHDSIAGSSVELTEVACYSFKAGVHLNVVYLPLNMGLIEISRSLFKQYKNCLLITQFYV